MAIIKPISHRGDISRHFISEDGKHYRRTRQNMDPVIKHVEMMREKVNEAPRSTNKREWRYAGSVPMSILLDWLTKNRYTFDQWARNEDKAKDKFLRYFRSREFAKLHTDHVTTKRESRQVVISRKES